MHLVMTLLVLLQCTSHLVQMGTFLISTGNISFKIISYHTYTDKDRLILYNWENGKQITSFYGSINDEFSQPRHCWDPSGLYIYGVSAIDSLIFLF